MLFCFLFCLFVSCLFVFVFCFCFVVFVSHWRFENENFCKRPTYYSTKHAKGAIIFFRMGVLMHKLGVTKSFYEKGGSQEI